MVFSNQKIILTFLFGQWWGGSDSAKILVQILVAAAVFVFVPIIAHCYGTVAKSVMKLIKME